VDLFLEKNVKAPQGSEVFLYSYFANVLH